MGLAPAIVAARPAAIDPASVTAQTGTRMWTIIIVIALLIAVLLLASWHQRTFAYRCRNCSHEFAVSLPMDFISPHGPGLGGGWKLLRCPSCRRWTRAGVMRKSEMRDQTDS